MTPKDKYSVTLDIMGCRLVQTCVACPEQYDVYLNEDKIGYLRLRHGYFTAEYRGKIVYEASPKGDGLFECEEREFYLTQAVFAILQRHNLKLLEKAIFNV